MLYFDIEDCLDAAVLSLSRTSHRSLFVSYLDHKTCAVDVFQGWVGAGRAKYLHPYVRLSRFYKAPETSQFSW